MSTYYLTRTGNPSRERWVRIGTSKKHLQRVDPQDLLTLITWSYVSRDACVVDFAQGIVDLGHTVRVKDTRRRNGGPPHFYQHRHRHTVGLEYWLLGRIWALGQIRELQNLLTNYRIYTPETRHHIFIAMAEYYWRNRWDTQLKLIIPA